METMNINIFGKQGTSCYRLRGEKVRLSCKASVGCVPDGDGYLQVWDETFGTKRFKTPVRLNEGRKQAAARQVIPRESIKVVKLSEPNPVPVTMAILEGKSADEVKIARLEARIKELLGMVRK